MAFVKTAMFEVIVNLGDAIEQLKKSADPVALKKRNYRRRRASRAETAEARYRFRDLG